MEGVMQETLYMDFYLENKFFILIGSLCLFLLFLKRKEFTNKYINYLAGSAFGVYLIHCNCFFIASIWSIFKVKSYYNSPYLFIIGILLTLLLYIVCSGIDIIRRLTIEKLWIWIIDNKLNSLPKWIEDKTDALIEKFI